MANKPKQIKPMPKQVPKKAEKGAEKAKVTYVYRKDAFNKVKLA
jgi:hypothetical protein